MRRSLDDNVRRTAHLRVRLKAVELAQLKGEAQRMGIRFPDLVRERVLTGKLVVMQTRALPGPVWEELRRIGVNLNQVVKRLHMEPFADPDHVAAIRQAADEITRQLLAGAKHEPRR